MILKYGGLEPLLNIVNTTTNRIIIKHGTWAISNLCRGKPLPDINLVSPAIPTLAAVLMRETDIDVLTDAAWALSYLSRREQEVARLVETGVIPSLVKQLEYDNIKLSKLNFSSNAYLALLIPCLRTLGNIITGTEEQTNVFYNF